MKPAVENLIDVVIIKTMKISSKIFHTMKSTMQRELAYNTINRLTRSTKYS